MARPNRSDYRGSMTETSDRKTIAVVGLGSIGGIITGLLRAADRHDVIACVRRPINHLTVERAEGAIEVPLRALTDPDQASPVDWVLLCTKAHDTPSSAPWLKRLCAPQTRVAVLQNGIGHKERLAPLVGDATVVPTIVYYNGERLAPDRVRFRRAGDHEFAVGDDAAARAFEALLEGTAMRVMRNADFTTRAWRKLLINAVANPITALTLQRQAVFRREDVKALCLAILEEAAAVGKADGAQARSRRARANHEDASDLPTRCRHLDVFRSPRRPPVRGRCADRRHRRCRRAPRRGDTIQQPAADAVTRHQRWLGGGATEEERNPA